MTLGRSLASLALSFLICKLEVGGGICKAFPQTLRGGCPNPIPVCLLCARKTMVNAGQMVPGLMEWTVLWRWPALIMWLPTQVKTHICGQDQEGGEPRAPSAYNNGKRGKCDLSWACWGSSHDNEPRTAHSRGRCGHSCLEAKKAE